MTEANYKRFRCSHCAVEFEAAKEKRYCSKKCNRAAIKKNGSIPRSEYLAKVRENAASKFVCEHCGKESFRSLSGTNKKSGIVNRFCSMQCRKDATVARLAALKKEADRLAAIVKPEVEALRRIAKYVERPSLFRAKCRHCDAPIIIKRCGGLHKTICTECRSASIKAARAISKAKRRAVERGALAENINPSDVFERDKWTCRLCGVKTPKSLRGTYESRAPELDHIIPLSKGGAHVMTNVQCSCRKCNGAKSDRPLGQMMLIG